jgi:hypothetical protein
MPSEREQVQTELINDLLERLSNTPLMTLNSRGEQINQTARIFWAINFLCEFAKERSLPIEFGRNVSDEDD